MRGGKDEEEQISPMFPRLHVNDAEKGGPRAPPRNKMALYEQLSVPSQRFTPGSGSYLPLPHNNGCRLVPSPVSSQGGSHRRITFSPLCDSPPPSFQVEKLHSNFPGAAKRMTVMAEDELKPSSLRAFRPLSSHIKYHSLEQTNIPNLKSFSSLNVGCDSDFSVPTLTRVPQQTVNGIHNEDEDRLPHLSLSSSLQLQTVSAKQGLKSREHTRKQFEENRNMSRRHQNHKEMAASISSARDKASVDSSPKMVSEFKGTGNRKRPNASLCLENVAGSVDSSNSMTCNKKPVCQERVSLGYITTNKDANIGRPSFEIDEVNASVGRGESCSGTSHTDDNRHPNSHKKISKPSEEKKGGSTVHLRDADKHDNISEKSLLNPVSAAAFSTDDIVKMLGEKVFWKARKTISNQQRIFAMQVFELHRLIKVQTLLAGSPHLCLEDSLRLVKVSPKVPDAMKRPKDSAPEVPQLTVNSKDSSQRRNQISGPENANAFGKLTFPPLNVDSKTNKGILTQTSGHELHMRNNSKKPEPWCFNPPPGHHWLVPVMSPSEGLVYKPYTGSCPPNTGFMAPMYGGCVPVSLNPGNGEFFNAAFPASHQQGIGIPSGAYFPPYCLPMGNQSFSCSAIELMNPFLGGRGNGRANQLSTGEANYTAPYQGSCNTPTQMSQVMSSHLQKLRGSKESELQGSTASSPSERAAGDAVNLFPLAPATTESDQDAEMSERRIQVIKVVPHNAQSASESAARIFRSIQEGRRNSDHIFCSHY